jgi:hypothetical protein
VQKYLKLSIYTTPFQFHYGGHVIFSLFPSSYDYKRNTGFRHRYESWQACEDESQHNYALCCAFES